MVRAEVNFNLVRFHWSTKSLKCKYVNLRVFSVNLLKLVQSILFCHMYSYISKKVTKDYGKCFLFYQKTFTDQVLNFVLASCQTLVWNFNASEYQMLPPFWKIMHNFILMQKTQKRDWLVGGERFGVFFLKVRFFANIGCYPNFLN